MVMKLRRSVAEIYDSITVEDAGGLAAFDYEIAVVLLVVNEDAARVKQFLSKLLPAGGVMVLNDAFRVHYLVGQVGAGVVVYFVGTGHTLNIIAVDVVSKVR